MDKEGEEKMKKLAGRILRSAQRLECAAEGYEKEKDPVWLCFLRKESTILVRRAISFWLRVRLRLTKI